MPIQWDYKDPFLCNFRVELEHIDELGHTNNAVYNKWCEQTAWEHSSKLGLESTHYTELKRAMAIQEANYKYLAPSFVNNELAVATWLTGSDHRLTLERRFQIYNVATNTCIFRGLWRLVCINLTSNKAARMPKEFKEVYLPHLVDNN